MSGPLQRIIAGDVVGPRCHVQSRTFICSVLAIGADDTMAAVPVLQLRSGA